MGTKLIPEVTPGKLLQASLQNPIGPPIGAVTGKLVRYGIVAGAGAVGALLLGGKGQEQQTEQTQAADLQTQQRQDLAQRTLNEILTKINQRTQQDQQTAGTVTIGGAATGARILSPETTSTTQTTTSTITTTYNIQAPTTYSIQQAAQEQKSDQSQIAMDGTSLIIIAAILGGAMLLRK